MKNSVYKRVVGAVLAGLMVVSPTQMIPADLTAFADMSLTTSPSHTRDEGWYKNYHHEIWQADTPNSSSMTLHDNDGGFSTKWKCGPNNSKGNFLARRGLYYGLDNPKTWKDYGGFTCDFDCNWWAGQSGNSRICIYGWAQNPLVEYYIIEDWKNWNPGQDPSAKYKGTAYIDGSNYKIYTSDRYSYTIEGTKAFTQYISIREKTRTSGTISISEHFKEWERLGMKMGNFYETAFNVEGWESDGEADVKCTIKEGSGTPIYEPETPPDPDSNGDYFTSSFESGKDNWGGRGDASVALDTKNYYGGKQSRFVSGRTKEWNGTSIDLSTSTFVPGSTYSFSTGVLQKSGSATNMKLTLQYKDSSGTAQYDEVASVLAKSGEWTKLENKAYTIPSGASDLVLYVESASDTNSFFIDDAAIAAKGTKIPSSAVNVMDEITLGDVNSDGKVTVLDLAAMKSYLKGRKTIARIETADLNSDGSIDDTDLELIREILVYGRIITVIEPPVVDDPPPEVPERKEGYYYNLADVSNIDPNKPMVAFAFDDGPIGGSDAYNVTRIHNSLSTKNQFYNSHIFTHSSTTII